MARLPVPGSDDNVWGNVLNDYLSQAHNTDGSLKDVGVVATKYVKPGTGIPKSDLAAAVQSSLDSADNAAAATDVATIAADLDAAEADIDAIIAANTDASALTTGSLGIERLTAGSIIVVDYYKNIYGSANAWPVSRPTARNDIVVVWMGPSDPGVIALAGDILELADA